MQLKTKTLKRLGLAASSTVLLALLVAGCGTVGSTPKAQGCSPLSSDHCGPIPGIDPTPSPTVSAQPTLLAAYWEDKIISNGTQSLTYQEVVNMRYMPRQFAAPLELNLDGSQSAVKLTDAGNFAGWDVLITRNNGDANAYYPNNNYVRLLLNRSATVGIVWWGDPSTLPSWMGSGWVQTGTVTALFASNDKEHTGTVFTQVLAAGEHYLGPIENKAPFMYTVILAESNGTPSQAPPVPAGVITPKPNETCPAWVIDQPQYLVKGPSGKWRHTWHPMIDPVYWCYFRHEHGSDPSTFAGYPQIKPIFNQFGDLAAESPDQMGKLDMNEAPAGFKVFTFDAVAEDGKTYSFMITQHMMTSGYHRICGRFHTEDLAIADKATGQIIADLHFKPDFGFARGIPDSTNIAAGGPTYQLKPNLCPDNYTLTPAETGGRRNIQIENGKYESWEPAYPTPTNTGPGPKGYIPIVGTFIPVNDEPMTSCVNDIDSSGIEHCNSIVPNPGQSGARRWFNFADAGTVGFGVDTKDLTGSFKDYLVQHNGVYYTDYMGRKLLSPTDPNAVKQYVNPNIRVVTHEAGKWVVLDPWTDLYVNSIVQFNQDFLPRITRDLENSIRMPN